MAAIPVLYLLDFSDLGGGETSFVALLRALLAGDAVRPVVVMRQEGPLARALETLGVQPRMIDYPLRLRRGPLPWIGWRSVAELAALIERERIELIHANNLFGMIHGGLAARRCGRPLAWTCHGWWELDNGLKRWWARRLIGRAACVSGAVAAVAERVLPGRVTVDYLGLEPFAPHETAADRRALRARIRAELDVPDTTPLLGVVGRFQPVKGHRHLLDALPALLARCPALQVWLIGDALFDDAGEQREKARIVERIAAQEWGQRVRLLGFRSDARRLMRALDALVVPSERESFSMAALEGLEAGIPVVAPDGSGPAEIVAVPQCGRLFMPGDAADLARRIDEALTGEGFDSEAGPHRVRAQFSIEAHRQRTLAIYAALMAKPLPGID